MFMFSRPFRMIKTIWIHICVLSLVYGVHFLRGFEASTVQDFESCQQKNAVICDPSGILQSSDVLRLQSEVNTWELILSSLRPTCPACKPFNDGCDTIPKVYLVTEIETWNYNFVARNNSVFVAGRCKNNISIAFSFENCFNQGLVVLSTLMPKNTSHFKTPVKETPLSTALPAYISSFIHWYYNVLAISNTQNISAKIELFRKIDIRELTCYTTSVKISGFKNNTGNTPVPAFNVTNVTIITPKEHLLTHHSHHGITNNILTIIACVLGSGAMSLLLCFRRIRHFVCSVCMLCRSADDFRSLLADPDA